MASIFVGGAVGAVMGEAAKFTIQAVNDGRQFVPTLEMNQETLNALTPLVEKIEYYDNLLGNPRKERLQLQTLLRESEELIRKCTKELSPLKFLCSRYYRTRLLKKNHKKLESYLNNIVQVEIKRDLMEVKADLKLIIDFVMRMMNIENFGGGSQILGLRCIPEEPVVKCVGMDEPLNRLKIELIKDGVSAHVLNGNTLAKKVCWDSQIQGKFGANIFFVTLSKTPNLIKNIVQTLWQQYGLQVPEMHNDEDAIIPLRFLLDIFSKNPILLVLDNVWPGSESRIENFVYMLEEYLLHCKILVVSSTAFPFPFTRYDTQCELYPLDHDYDHDYAVSLFHHFAQLDRSSSDMPDQDLVCEGYVTYI